METQQFDFRGGRGSFWKRRVSPARWVDLVAKGVSELSAVLKRWPAPPARRSPPKAGWRRSHPEVVAGRGTTLWHEAYVSSEAGNVLLMLYFNSAVLGDFQRSFFSCSTFTIRVKEVITQDVSLQHSSLKEYARYRQ